MGAYNHMIPELNDSSVTGANEGCLSDPLGGWDFTWQV
jgi:hypothetical protein